MFWLTVVLFVAYNIVDAVPKRKILEKNNG